MMQLAWQVLQQSITITAFVAMMMLAIEYINVTTKGVWMLTIGGSRWKQYIMGILLGVIPGCLGAFAMVSLYAHKRVTIGAVVAAMIATSGDEAFIMLAMFPKNAILIFVGIMFLGLLVGWATDAFFLKSHESSKNLTCDFNTHHEWESQHIRISQILEQWRHPSALRSILVVSIGLFLVLIFAFELGLLHPADGSHGSLHGHEGHHDEGSFGWERATLVGLLIFGLIVVGTVTDHFLDEHLWKHVLKIHVPKIFLWTVGALTLVTIFNHFVDLDHIVADNLWLILLVAVGVGLIPESGPHLVFVTLYASGTIPLSIFIASCVVQDGHGMVPLLAHSRKDFFTVKTINAAVGLLLGASMILMGW